MFGNIIGHENQKQIKKSYAEVNINGEQKMNHLQNEQQNEQNEFEKIPSVSKTAILSPESIPLPGTSHKLNRSHPRFLNPRIEVPVSISKHTAWKLLSNLDQNKDFHSGITSQEIINTPLRGIGTVRWTRTVDGTSIIDKVIEWIPNNRIVVELLIQPEDYPFELGSREIIEINSIQVGENEQTMIALEMQVIVKDENYDMAIIKKNMISQFQDFALSVEKFGIQVEKAFCKQFKSE